MDIRSCVSINDFKIRLKTHFNIESRLSLILFSFPCVYLMLSSIVFLTLFTIFVFSKFGYITMDLLMFFMYMFVPV